ncbi:hypothetical protein EHN46_02585 [Salmonella enterica]|nr:hypothetical protein [Salmonella enterica]
MGSNIIELAKLGHERAAELKASCGAVDVRSLAQLISDLATQLEVQFVRSTNMAVQLANAESKCRELAAENAALKKSEVEFNDYCRHECEDVGDTWVDDFTETPDTDAFLSEMRAQGVERYAAQLKSEAELADETGWDGAAKFLISESEKVLAFAVQIRQEAAK